MWSIKVLQDYISNEVEESLHLDFKAAGALSKEDKKKTEISKDVSALANADGGIIIYGLAEYQKGTRFLAEKIDPIDRNEFSKETLEQIINSRISPRISGIKITPITIGEPENNKVVYAVEVPKGNTVHQAYDKRYYRRFNFESVPMEDYEIKDIINRQIQTDPEIRFRPLFDANFFEMYKKNKNHKLNFEVIAANAGMKAIRYLHCFIKGDKQFAPFFYPGAEIKGGSFEIKFSNEIELKARIADDEFVINTQNKILLPKTTRPIGELVIYSDFFTQEIPLTVIISTEDNRKKYVIKSTEFRME